MEKIESKAKDFGFHLIDVQKTKEGWRMYISREQTDIIIDILIPLEKKPQFAIDMKTGGFLIVKSPPVEGKMNVPIEVEAIKDLRIMVTNGFKLEFQQDQTFHVIPV